MWISEEWRKIIYPSNKLLESNIKDHYISVFLAVFFLYIMYCWSYSLHTILYHPSPTPNKTFSFFSDSSLLPLYTYALLLLFFSLGCMPAVTDTLCSRLQQSCQSNWQCPIAFVHVLWLWKSFQALLWDSLALTQC